jgi:hypothetical protein
MSPIRVQLVTTYTTLGFTQPLGATLRSARLASSLRYNGDWAELGERTSKEKQRTPTMMYAQLCQRLSHRPRRRNLICRGQEPEGVMGPERHQLSPHRHSRHQNWWWTWPGQRPLAIETAIATRIQLCQTRKTQVTQKHKERKSTTKMDWHYVAFFFLLGWNKKWVRKTNQASEYTELVFFFLFFSLCNFSASLQHKFTFCMVRTWDCS